MRPVGVRILIANLEKYLFRSLYTKQADLLRSAFCFGWGSVFDSVPKSLSDFGLGSFFLPISIVSLLAYALGKASQSENPSLDDFTFFLTFEGIFLALTVGFC